MLAAFEHHGVLCSMFDSLYERVALVPYVLCLVTVYVVRLWSQQVCHSVMAGIALGAELCVMAAAKPMLC